MGKKRYELRSQNDDLKALLSREIVTRMFGNGDIEPAVMNGNPVMVLSENKTSNMPSNGYAIWCHMDDAPYEGCGFFFVIDMLDHIVMIDISDEEPQL